MSSARSTYRRPRTALVVLAVLIGLAMPIVAAPAGAAGPIAFTILHTNDFHGNLELSGSNPGAARVAQKIADVRTAVGAANVLTFDAGDIMHGGNGSDDIEGGEGADTLYGDGDGDHIDGGKDGDTIYGGNETAPAGDEGNKNSCHLLKGAWA